MIERTIGRALYEREVQQRLLGLREDLVRHDENLAAWHLLDKAVPYFLRDDSQIRAAKNAQWEMVKHLFERAVYEAYYATNAHERPFEQQYRLEIEQADELPRVAWLKARIAQLWPDAEDPNVVSMLDLGANDGWLAAHIGLAYGQAIQFDCVDLHPDNVRGARARAREGAPIRKVWMVDACAEQAPWKLGTYDGVMAFELIEHVAEPLRLLEVMAAARSTQTDACSYRRQRALSRAATCPAGPMWSPRATCARSARPTCARSAARSARSSAWWSAGTA